MFGIDFKMLLEADDDSTDYSLDGNKGEKNKPDKSDSNDTDYSLDGKNSDDTANDDNSETIEDESDSDTVDNTDKNEPTSEDDGEVPKEKIYLLLKKYQELYNYTSYVLDKITYINSDEDMALINMVTNNLNDLQSKLYDYLILKFKENTYVDNLKTFLYFTNFFKFNHDSIEKIVKLSRNK